MQMNKREEKESKKDSKEMERLLKQEKTLRGK